MNSVPGIQRRGNHGDSSVSLTDCPSLYSPLFYTIFRDTTTDLGAYSDPFHLVEH